MVYFKGYSLKLFLHKSYMSNYPQFNVNNEHQLIRRQNTYVLDRKLVTIHTEDRDINKWAHPNHFEVELPEALTNVQSMRLVEIEFPSNQYVFSNNQQNTKMEFYVIPTAPGNPPATYIALSAHINKPFTITIQAGFYTPEQMALEIQNLMNKAIEALPLVATYDKFKVHYDTVGQKMFFGNTYDNFTFKFDEKIEYDVSCNAIIGSNQSPNVWNQYTKWGLPSYLGFNKKNTQLNPNYTTTSITEPYVFNYSTSSAWLTPDPSNNMAYYLSAPLAVCMSGESAIYMEFDKYNSMDELKPYPEHTNDMYNNDYNGSVNAAFAKIPITSSPHSQVFDSKFKFLQNVSQYHPPIDKIRKVKFKFRYHDGRLVDFQDCNFNFTVAFNQLRDEIARDYEIRVPAAYQL